MKRGVICLPVMAAVVALSGMGCSVPCSTLTDARAGKGTGCSRLYDRVSFETVWGSVRSALADVGLTIVSENREKGYILAYRDVTGFSWGENVAAFVEETDGDRIRVEVVSKKVLAVNITAPDWETPVLERVTELVSKKR
jgi:uncharacterized lipoprotein